MTDAALCFLIRGNPPDEILLGFKKVGCGHGKYGGFGGKVEQGETVRGAAVRELEEETGVKISDTDLQQVAHLTFLFPAKPAWSQTVYAFLVRRWEGNPVETPEMKPAWFEVNDIPFENMWQDCCHWLPRVLAGARIRASFTFRIDNETIDEMEIGAWGNDC